MDLDETWQRDGELRKSEPINFLQDCSSERDLTHTFSW